MQYVVTELLEVCHLTKLVRELWSGEKITHDCYLFLEQIFIAFCGVKTYVYSFFPLLKHNICRKEFNNILATAFISLGISWTLLHEMDYQKYMDVRYDYILLPDQAQTNTTRLRWWQPFTISNGFVVPSPDRAQWALDNILIGGAEINPSQLVDTFDDGMFVTNL